MVSREEVPGGWGAGGAHSYEVLESDQHSEICSEPLIFSWFVINCPLHHRGVQNCLTKLVEKKVRFFKLDMSKLIYFG